MKKSLLAVAALTLLFGACKKEDGNNSVNGKKNTLTSGKWRMTASTSTVEWPAPIGTQTADLMDLLDDCQLDNLYIFNADNTVSTDEGATKCNSSDPQVKTSGSWSLTDNDTKLAFSEGSNSVTADIQTLDANTLKIQYVTTANSIKSTTVTTYTHVQ